MIKKLVILFLVLHQLRLKITDITIYKLNLFTEVSFITPIH